MEQLAVETVNLTRVFDSKGAEVVALDDVNIQIQRGEICGLLGRNGAGKTTLIKILTTLLYPSAGRAFVGGFDVVKEPRSVRRIINMVCGGEESGYGMLTVEENLWMFSQFHGIPGRLAKARISELIALLGIGDVAKRRLNTLSTGARQKVNLARGFLTEPQVLFLDEPSLGLDVNTAYDLRQYVKTWVSQQYNRTVLLTTHQMAEAEQLCDRVAILDMGRLLVCDTPSNIKRMLREEAVFRLEVDFWPPNVGWLTSDGEARILNISKVNGHVSVDLAVAREDQIVQIMSAIASRRTHILSVTKCEANLEEVFIKLVRENLRN